MTDFKISALTCIAVVVTKVRGNPVEVAESSSTQVMLSDLML
jgi:hypothetical protein